MLTDDTVLATGSRYELVAAVASFAETRALGSALAGAVWVGDSSSSGRPCDASVTAVRCFTGGWLAVLSWTQREARTVGQLRQLASLTLPDSLGGEKWNARANVKLLARKDPPPALPRGADTPGGGFLETVERIFDRGADAAENVAGTGAVALSFASIAWTAAIAVGAYLVWRNAQ